MESLRILDEWSVFKDRITQETVLQRTAKPTGGLSAEQAEMLKYVDGKNDTTVVAELYGLDAFEGAKILLKLLESGYVEPRRNAPGPLGPAPDKRSAEIPGLALIIGVIAVLALALSIFAHVIGVSYSTENIKASEALDRLRFELEVKKYQTGTYPASVAETDPWGSSYVVKTTIDGLVIFSPGPDRTANTLDDIY